MSIQFPDVEGALRTYLRSHPDVQAQVAQRVWFGIPLTPTYPLVAVARVGGFDDPSDAPIDQALVQIDCWGSLHDDTRNSPNKAEAHAVRLACRQALHDLNARTVVGLTRLGGAVIQSDLYLEDPADRRPRYVITAQITAHTLNP